MLERVLEKLLLRYLAPYVDGISKDNLRLGLLHGVLTFQDLRVKPDALLSLGFKVKNGNVGLLNISVPWQRLYSGKVVIDVKDVHFEVEKLADDGMSDEDIINKMREAKQQAIKVHVEQLKNLVEQENERLTTPAAYQRTASKKIGFGTKVAQRIVNNINISIEQTSASYIHVLNGLACGVKLQNLDVSSTNAQFDEEAEPSNEVVPDGTLYKRVRLERLRILMADVGNSSLEGAGYILHPVSAQLELTHEPSNGRLLASFKAANKELLELTFWRSQVKHVRRVLAERSREHARLQELMVSPAERKKILNNQDACIDEYNMLCKKQAANKMLCEKQAIPEPLEDEEANRLRQLLDVLPVRLLARTQLHVVQEIEAEHRAETRARTSAMPVPASERSLARLKRRLHSVRDTWISTRSLREVWFELFRALPDEDWAIASFNGGTLLQMEDRRRLLQDLSDESNADMPQTMTFEFELGMLAVDLIDDRWSCEEDRQLLSLALEQARVGVSVHFTPILHVRDSVDWKLDVRLSTFHAMHAMQSVFQFCPLQHRAGISPYKQRLEGSAVKPARAVSRLNLDQAARLAVESESGEEENIMTLLFDFAPTEIKLPQGLVAEIQDFWRAPELPQPIGRKDSEDAEVELTMSGLSGATVASHHSTETISVGEIIHQQVDKAVGKAVKNRALAATVADKVHKQIPDKLVLRVKIASPTFYVPVPGKGETAFSLGLFQIATPDPCRYSELKLECELDDMVLWATTIRGERFDILQPVLINVTVKYESTDQGNSLNIDAEVERQAELSLKLTPQALQMLMATPFAISGVMKIKDREPSQLDQGEVVRCISCEEAEQIDAGRDDMQDTVVEVNNEPQHEPHRRPFHFNMTMNLNALDVTLVDSVVPVIVMRMQWLRRGLHICSEGTLNIELPFTVELLILNPRNNAYEQLVERFHGEFELSRHAIGGSKDTLMVISGHEELLLNLKPTIVQRVIWFVPRLLKGLTFDRDLVITSSDGETSDVSKYRVVNLCGQALQLEFKSPHRSGLIKPVGPTGSNAEQLDDWVLAPYFATALVVTLPDASSSSQPLSLENNGAVAIPSSGDNNDCMHVIAELLTPSPSDRMQHRMLLLSSPVKVHNTTDLTLLVRFHAAEGDHSKVLKTTSNWSRCCDGHLLGYFPPEGLGSQSGGCGSIADNVYKSEADGSMGHSPGGGCNEDDDGAPVLYLSPNSVAAVPSGAISFPDVGVCRVWLSFRPVGPKHTFCDVTEAGTDVGDQMLQCKGQLNWGSMHIVCRSTTPPGPVSLTTIVLQAPVVILNALPIFDLVVDYGLPATNETRDRAPALFCQQATVPARCRLSLYDFPGILWQGGISIRARINPTGPWSSTLRLAPDNFDGESCPVGTLGLCQMPTGAAAGITVEQLERRELRFSCPYWFVDRSGLREGLSLGLKFSGRALPRDSGITLLPATCLEEDCELVVGGAVVPEWVLPGGCCSMGTMRRITFRMPPSWSVVTVPSTSAGPLVFCVQADDVASSDVLGAECQVMTLRPQLIFTNSSTCSIELKLADHQHMILEAGKSHEHHYKSDGGEGSTGTTVRFRPCETACDWSGAVNCSDKNAGSTPFLFLAGSSSHVWSVEVAPSRGSLAVSFRPGSDFVAANRTSWCKVSIQPLSDSPESETRASVAPGSQVLYGWADPTPERHAAPERRAVKLFFRRGNRRWHTHTIEDVRRTLRHPVRLPKASLASRKPFEIDVVVSVSRVGTQTLLAIEDPSAAHEPRQQSSSTSNSKSCLRVEVKLRSVGISLIEEMPNEPFARELLFVHLELIRLEWQKEAEKDEQQLRLGIYEMQVDCQLSSRLDDNQFDERGFLEQDRPVVILANLARGDQPFLKLFIQRGATSSRDMVLPKIEFQLDDLDITVDDGWVDPLVSFAKQCRSHSTGDGTPFLAIQEMADKPFTRGYMFPPMPPVIQVDCLKIMRTQLTLWCAIKLRSLRSMKPHVRTAFKMLSFSDELTLEGAPLLLRGIDVPLTQGRRGSLMDFAHELANLYTLELLAALGTALGRSSLLNLPRVPMKIGGGAFAWVADGVGTLAGGAVSLLNQVTFDDEYISRQKKKKDTKEITGITAGVAEAVQDIGQGLDGVKDFWKKPEEGWNKGGLCGAVKGLGYGMVSGVVKPTANIGQAFADCVTGLGATAAQATKKVRRGRQRLRQPRLLYTRGAAIRTWCELDAELLRQLGSKRLFGVEEVVCLEQREQQHTVMLLFKDRFLLGELHTAVMEVGRATSSTDILGAIDETTTKILKPMVSGVNYLQKQLKGEELNEEMPEFGMSMDLCLLRNAEIDDHEQCPCLRLTKEGSLYPIILALHRGQISRDVQEGLLAGFRSAVEHLDGAANWDKLHQALLTEQRSRQEFAQHDSILLEAGKKTVEVFEVERWQLTTRTWNTPFLPIDKERCWRWVDATGRKHPHLRQNLKKEESAAHREPPCEFDALFDAQDDWQVEKGETTDSDGWRYGLAWRSSTWDNVPGMVDVLRKRKWRRTYG